MKKLDKDKCVKIASRILSGLLAALVVFCMVVVVQVFSRGYVSIFGYSFFKVITPSMEPSIMVGEIIITDKVHIGEVEVDDVVSFKSLSPDMYGTIITHRVIKIEKDEKSETCLLTKGDANLSVDGRYVTRENFIGKVVWTSGDSFISSAFSFVSGRYGFLACVLMPSILVFACILSGSVKRIQNSMQNLVEMTEQQNAAEKSNAPVITKQEYEQMYDRIRNELIEEIKNSAQTRDSKTE